MLQSPQSSRPSTIEILLAEVLADRREWIQFVIGSVTQSISLLPVPWLCRNALDQAIPGGSSRDLLLISGAMILLAALNAAAVVGSQRVGIAISLRAVRRIRRRMFASLREMPLARVHRLGQDTLHTRLLVDATFLENTFAKIVNQFLPALLPFAVVVGLMLWTCWELAALIFIIVPVYWLCWRVWRPKMAEAQRSQNLVQDLVTGTTTFFLDAIELIRVGSGQQTSQELQDRVLETVKETVGRNQHVRLAFSQIQNVIGAIWGAGVLCLGGHLVFWGRISMGDLGGFLVLAAIGRRFIGTIVSMAPMFVSSRLAAERVDEALTWEGRGETCSGRELPEFSGRIRLSGASFGYSPNQPVLKDIDLEIEPGKLVALQGENGAGKSTLLRLILGYYTPWSGTILADGYEYEELDLEALRARFGYLPQETVLMPGSIRENVTFLRPEIDDQSYGQAVEASGLVEIIEELSQGDATAMGIAGHQFSGGQRQRVGLARAIAGAERLLVLDEPTNHLDGPSIRRLIQGLREIKRDRAILVVSHHPWISDAADRVYRLEYGQATLLSDASQGVAGVAG